MSVLLALGLLAGFSGAAAPGAGSESLVGSAGAPRSFRYVGCKAFSPSQIAAALECSLDVQVASIPGAPLNDYLSVVRHAVTSGYWNAGHLAATVTVVRDAALGAVVVTVSEGPRYTCGPVRVTGAKTLPVEQFVAKLTREQPATLFPLDFNPRDGAFRVRASLEVKDPELPPWSPGERVRGDAFSGQKLREALRRSGCELGYFDLWAEYRFTTDTPVSTLEINVRNEGPRAVLDAVEVTGVRKNLPDRVRELTGLQLGQPLDLVRLRDVQQRLWDAARFTEHTIYAAPQRGDPSRMRVRVELREYEHAPRLHEPFSPVEQAALNFQRWASDIGDRDEELFATAHFPSGRVDCAVGHRRGFAAGLRGVGKDNAPQFGVFATPLVMGLASGSGGRMFRRDIPPMNLHADLTVGPAPEPNDGRQMTTGLNFGANSRPRPDGPPLELRLALAPVSFVQLVHRDDSTFTLRDGVLEGKGKWIRQLAVDAATGRLLELRAASEDGQKVVTISVTKGTADELVDSMTRGARNAYDPAAPVASFVRFVATQAVNIRAFTGGEAPPRDRRPAAAAAENLLSNDALASLEPLGTSLAESLDPTGFHVPNPPLSEQRAPFAYTIRPLVKPVDDLFPRGSWPWTLARLGILVPAGEYRGATEEVGRLMASDDVGPVGYLVAAELLARANAPMAAPFARRGLERLDVERFDKDLDQLLSEGFPPAQVLGRLAMNLRGLTPAEVEALSAELPAGVGPRLVAHAETLRRQPDAAPQPLLRAAMRDAWSVGLRQAVETRLRALASVEPPQP